MCYLCPLLLCWSFRQGDWGRHPAALHHLRAGNRRERNHIRGRIPCFGIRWRVGCHEKRGKFSYYSKSYSREEYFDWLHAHTLLPPSLLTISCRYRCHFFSIHMTLSEQEVGRVVIERASRDFLGCAKALCSEALIMGSTDNVTALVIDLK